MQVDQSPIGRTPRSNPATYTGVFDEIRKVFANTRDARQRGYKAGRFSFNVKGGRCEECQGQGQRRIEMNFLPDLYVDCPVCEGKRFNRQTLEIRYRDRSIADVLDMQVEEAAGFFENFPAIARLVGSLQEVGLGYVTLGQPSTTLSGGEAQRIKLATELSRVDTGKTVYILDEPTTGLHFDDIRRLLVVLGRLVDLGNTVLVIEHNLDVIKTADWIINLGPEGGEGGGQVIATGPPEEIAAIDGNYTGQFLRTVLSKNGSSVERSFTSNGMKDEWRGAEKRPGTAVPGSLIPHPSPIAFITASGMKKFEATFCTSSWSSSRSMSLSTFWAASGWLMSTVFLAIRVIWLASGVMPASVRALATSR